jgi:hypothetical protein
VYCDDVVALLASLAASARPRVVIAGEHAAPDLPELLARHGIVHVIATQGETAERDVGVTIEKLVSRDLFGLDRYLGDAAPARFVSRSSARRDELIEWVRAYGEEHRIKRRLMDTLVVVADELFTNGFYNAPTDRGDHLYRDLPRTAAVALDAPAEIEIELRCDGRRFGIAARDPFGSLTPEVVLASLRRCFERAEPRLGGTGGAGLGLYMLFTSLTSVVFNISPGRRTEVIGLIDVAGTFRQSMSAGKSFNLFVEE